MRKCDCRKFSTTTWCCSGNSRWQCGAGPIPVEEEPPPSRALEHDPPLVTWQNWDIPRFAIGWNWQRDAIGKYYGCASHVDKQIGAMLAALILRRTLTKGSASGFIMELPKYQMPRLKDMALGLYQRVQIFLRRAGTIILTVSVILWLLLNFPRAGEGKDQVDASFAGHIANGLAVVLEPIGFNRDISLALIPAMAAREVAVSSLATTYAVGNADTDQQAQQLGTQLKSHWSLPTALAFLAWFVFAPQCMSTIAVTRRETNGWKWPGFMLAYLFGLAYIFAGITYWSAIALGL